MRLPPFAYERPRDLQEALELLQSYGSDCKVLAGGTDLLVRMKQGLVTPKYLISLKSSSELAEIKESEDTLRIGAAVKLSGILAYQPVRIRWPGLFEATPVFAPAARASTNAAPAPGAGAA